MDPAAVIRPRGPLPPSTYWLRRAVVLGGLVLLLLIVLKACGGDDGGTSRDTASPAASTDTEPTPDTSPTGSTTSAPSSPSPSATRPPAAACVPAALQVQALADRPAYKRPATPRLSLVIRNAGRTPCRLDVGPAQLELRVVSGPDRIWSSDDCAPGGAAQVVTLQPGGVQQSTVAWPLRRSRPGCPEGQAGAQPGTYRVIGRVGGITREGATFRLE